MFFCVYLKHEKLMKSQNTKLIKGHNTMTNLTETTMTTLADIHHGGGKNVSVYKLKKGNNIYFFTINYSYMHSNPINYERHGYISKLFSLENGKFSQQGWGSMERQTCKQSDYPLADIISERPIVAEIIEKGIKYRVNSPLRNPAYFFLETPELFESASFKEFLYFIKKYCKIFAVATVFDQSLSLKTFQDFLECYESQKRDKDTLFYLRCYHLKKIYDLYLSFEKEGKNCIKFEGAPDLSFEKTYSKKLGEDLLVRVRETGDGYSPVHEYSIDFVHLNKEFFQVREGEITSKFKSEIPVEFRSKSYPDSYKYPVYEYKYKYRGLIAHYISIRSDDRDIVEKLIDEFLSFDKNLIYKYPKPKQ